MAGGVDLNVQERARVEAREATKARRAAAKDHTLAKLCDCYVDHLRNQGKQSATDAAGLFERHVKGTEAAAKPAKGLTTKEAAAMVRVVSQAGHRRTAAKLRAYLRAAYALAQNAEDDIEAPAEFIAFNIEANPVAGTKPIKGNAIEARRVKLSEEELGETVRLLRSKRAAQYDDALAAMELSLELGGQRLAQVLRLTTADVDMDAGTVLLHDPKGRRSTPRPHLLPLTETAAQLVQQILNTRRADWLFGRQECADGPQHGRSQGRRVVGRGSSHGSPADQGEVTEQARAPRPPQDRGNDAGGDGYQQRPSRAASVSRHRRRAGEALRHARVHGREAPGTQCLVRSLAGVGGSEERSVEREGNPLRSIARRQGDEHQG